MKPQRMEESTAVSLEDDKAFLIGAGAAVGQCESQNENVELINNSNSDNRAPSITEFASLESITATALELAVLESDQLFGILDQKITDTSSKNVGDNIDSARFLCDTNSQRTLSEGGDEKDKEVRYYKTHRTDLHKNMAPPLKKRLSSSFALGVELPGWAHKSIDSDPNHSSDRLPNASNPVQMTTPRFSKEDDMHASFPPLAATTVSKGFKLISEPLLDTPCHGIYYGNLVSKRTRSIPTPSLEQMYGLSSAMSDDGSNLNPTPKQEMGANQSAMNTAKTPYRYQNNSTEVSENSNVGQAPQSALARDQRYHFLPVHDTHRYVPFSYDPLVLPQTTSHIYPHVHFSDSTTACVMHSQRSKAEAPSEITNILSDGRVVKYHRVNEVLVPSSLRSNRVVRPDPILDVSVRNASRRQSNVHWDSTIQCLLPPAVSGSDEEGSMEPTHEVPVANNSNSFPASVVATVMRPKAETLNTGIESMYPGCICKRSRCLKLYCKCFQSSKYCDNDVCKCKDCHNSVEHDGPGGKRAKTIISIRNRRPDAFETRPAKKSGRGCACKKNRCLKKYCDCFAIGSMCSESNCTCKGCENGNAGNSAQNAPDNPLVSKLKPKALKLNALE